MFLKISVLFTVLFCVVHTTATGQESPESARFNTPPFLVGACTHFAQDKGDLTANLNLIRQADIRSIRDEVYWNGIETEPGKLVMPEAWDRYVNSALRHDLLPLLILDYGNRFYDGGNKPISSEAQEGFANYCRFVAKHFSGKVPLYEVWNEFDIGIGTPNGEKGSPDDYTRLLKQAYPAIKSVDPDAIVLGGAVTSEGASGEWLKRAVSLGMLQHCDALSIHTYNYSAKGRGRSPETWREWVENLQRMLRANNDGEDVPLYITEMGWPTHVGERGMTPDTSAMYLSRMFLLARTLPYIQGIWWYDFQDDGWETGENEHNFGLVRPDLTPKPAYHALRSVSQLVAKAAFVDRVDAGIEDLWILRFRWEEGKETWAIWSAHETDRWQVVLVDENPSRREVRIEQVGHEPIVRQWGRRPWEEEDKNIRDDEIALTVQGLPVLVTGNLANVSIRNTRRRPVENNTQQ